MGYSQLAPQPRRAELATSLLHILAHPYLVDDRHEDGHHAGVSRRGVMPPSTPLGALIKRAQTTCHSGRKQSSALPRLAKTAAGGSRVAQGAAREHHAPRHRGAAAPTPRTRSRERRSLRQALRAALRARERLACWVRVQMRCTGGHSFHPPSMSSDAQRDPPYAIQGLVARLAGELGTLVEKIEDDGTHSAPVVAWGVAGVKEAPRCGGAESAIPPRNKAAR